jgi:hypothetical protein
MIATSPKYDAGRRRAQHSRKPLLATTAVVQVAGDQGAPVMNSRRKRYRFARPLFGSRMKSRDFRVAQD